MTVYDQTIINEISNISFGTYSTTEISNISVCKLDSPKKQGLGTVYDPRMGPNASSILCQTCMEDVSTCPGHFGRIELYEPIFHPLYYKQLIAVLSCTCFSCNRIMIRPEQLLINGLSNLRRKDRFDAILNKIKSINICGQPNCGHESPKLKLASNDTVVTAVYETGMSKPFNLSPFDVFGMLDKLSDSDITCLGFDPVLCHPRNYIMFSLLVLPSVDRPYVEVNGNIWDDDITIQYIEIVKLNEQVKGLMLTDTSSIVRRNRLMTSLIFRVSTMFNNSQNKAKHTTSGRPIKGFKERLTGKDGQIRNNMMGKRCNHTARTVIGPDPTLRSNQIAIPNDYAETLTVPVHVTNYNIKDLQKLVDSGVVNMVLKNDEKKTRVNVTRFRQGTSLMIDDIIFRGNSMITVKDPSNTFIMSGDVVKRNGVYLEKLKVSNRSYELSSGMVVHRPIKDGDVVLLNRQPTLHKGSMIAMNVILRPFKTIRMNLSICKSFNADFDGDEMNIHIPQSVETQAELRFISSAKYNIIAPQSSKPIMTIVQDSLVGIYRMTRGIRLVPKDIFYDIAYNTCMRVSDSFDIDASIQRIRRVMRDKGKKAQCFHGKGLISLFLPSDLNYTSRNGSNPDDPIVRIQDGVLYEGTLDKGTMGSSFHSLIHVIHKEYGSDQTLCFIDCVQFCTSMWLMFEGFSIGLGDCLIKDLASSQSIDGIIQKCLVEANTVKDNTIHQWVKEVRINAILNKAKDVGLKIAKDALDSENNFLSTVRSGSKGDFFNISQITGLIGQQNIKGCRIPNMLNNGQRSMYHYPFEHESLESEYESNGFISSSFAKGLNPREFFFHAMSGREGITDTAMGTATSGYMQRRIVKLMEDIKVQYDGTVRDIYGRIYQVCYGDNGLDPSLTTSVDGEQVECNVGRLIERLNAKYLKC